MSALVRPLPPAILSAAPFVPHSLEHLTEARVFPSPIPEVAYQKMLAEYAALEGVEVLDIVYDSGGLKVTGIMALPSVLRDAHPIVVYNRGGSREYGKLTILNVLRSMVPFAKAGYMVFASNYRGNGGSEGQEEFGGADVRDVMNLLSIARSHPAFDGENAFMVGHSRGAMMTALALKQGADVRAAVSIAGVTDARRFLEHEGLRERVMKPLVPGFTENPMAAAEARSSLLWPQHIAVPMLLLHGDADKDVPAEDSVALHAAIGAAGGMSELEIYPGGNHALLRHWSQVEARMLDWLERHKA